MSTRSTMYKKSVCRTRDSPGWLSMRVACSSSWKYSNRVPISSVNSSNPSYMLLSVKLHINCAANAPVLRAVSHTRPSNSCRLLQLLSIPQSCCPLLCPLHLFSPQADRTYRDVQKHSRRVAESELLGYAQQNGRSRQTSHRTVVVFALVV